MLTNLFILIAGFVLLIKGADYLVNGASRLARKFGVSPLVVGLTIVAFGTSAPEFIVNIIASLQNASDLTVGNIIGSNLSNIGLIVGLTALIYPLSIKESTTKKEIPFMLLAAVILIVVASDKFFNPASANVINQNDGVILLLIFGIFIYYLVTQVLGAKSQKRFIKKEFAQEFPKEQGSLLALLLIILLGTAGVLLGGKLTVDSAVAIATGLGVSQMLIGVTVVAVGTSLPELTTSLMAAYRKHSDIAVGNIVGSNIFNILPVLGLSAIINPIPFQTQWFFDLGVMLLFSVLMLIFSVTHQKLIKRWEGGVLLAAYFVYIIFVISRG